MVFYDLNNPVNIPCGKKPEYPELTHDFQEHDSLYISDINLRGKKHFCQIVRYDFIEIVLPLLRQKIQKWSANFYAFAACNEANDQKTFLHNTQKKQVRRNRKLKRRQFKLLEPYIFWLRF